MIRSPSPDLPLSPAVVEAAEWLRIALGDWLPLSGGLALESLFDRMEGRA